MEIESYWIAVSAGIISVATLIMSGLSLSRKSDVDYVQSLERRMELAETALARCHENEHELKEIVAGLERSNQSLMKALFAAQNDKR